jgi:hypothetical protein
MKHTNTSMSFDLFIEKANKVHLNKYKYESDGYVNAGSKVKISCPNHGIFYMVGSQHLHGQKCRKCSIEDKLAKTQDDRRLKFTLASEKIHGNKYDYSNVKYTNNRTKVSIKCKTHDEFFEQCPQDHVIGRGCPRCSGNKQLTTLEFVEKAKIIHGDRYTYNKVEYINTYGKIILTCGLHGDWTTIPNSVLSGYGCPTCGIIATSNSNKYTTDIFIDKATKIHKEAYEYDEVNYIASHQKVRIRCKKHDRIFEQTPANHLSGVGCPICCQSKGELKIFRYLINHSIHFTPQYKFTECKMKYQLPFDFGVLINGKIRCIEFQGGQHYHPVNRFGGKKAFDLLVSRDNIKKQYCLANSIPLLMIKYDRISEIDSILDDFLVDACALV